MKMTKDELLKSITDKLGDNENTVSILEDVADSFNDTDITDYENRIATLEQEKADIEKSWRDKYVARFSTPASDVVKEEEQINDDVETETMTIDEIAEKFI